MLSVDPSALSRLNTKSVQQKMDEKAKLLVNFLLLILRNRVMCGCAGSYISCQLFWTCNDYVVIVTFLTVCGSGWRRRRSTLSLGIARKVVVTRGNVSSGDKVWLLSANEQTLDAVCNKDWNWNNIWRACGEQRQPPTPAAAAATCWSGSTGRPTTDAVNRPMSTFLNYYLLELLQYWLIEICGCGKWNLQF